MFYQIYQKKFSTQLFAIILAVAVLWFPIIFADIPPVIGEHDSIFFQLFKNLNVYLLTFIVLGLISIQSIFIRYVTVANNLQRYSDLTTTFLYVLFMGSLTLYLNIHKGLFLNFIILLFFNRLFALYDDEKNAEKWFALSVLVGIASLFHQGNLLLLLLVGLSLITYRVYSIRIWIVSLLGVLSILIIFVFYLFWTNQLQTELEAQTYFISNFRLNFSHLFQFSTLPIFIVTIIASLAIAFSIMYYMDDYNIATRKRLTFILYHIIILWFSIIIFSQNSILYLFQLFVPISIGLGRILTKSYKNWLKKVLLLFLILSIVAERIYYFS